MEGDNSTYHAAVKDSELTLVGQPRFVHSRNRGDFEEVVGGAAVPEGPEEPVVRRGDHEEQRVVQTRLVLLLRGGERWRGEEEPRFDRHLLRLLPLLSLHADAAVRPDGGRAAPLQPCEGRVHVSGCGVVALACVEREEASGEEESVCALFHGSEERVAHHGVGDEADGLLIGGEGGVGEGGGGEGVEGGGAGLDRFVGWECECLGV